MNTDGINTLLHQIGMAQGRIPIPKEQPKLAKPAAAAAPTATPNPGSRGIVHTKEVVIREVPRTTHTIEKVPMSTTVELNLRPLLDELQALRTEIQGLKECIDMMQTRRVKRRVVKDADGYPAYTVEEPLPPRGE